MLNILQNEYIKILKRNHIYILFLIVILFILVFNLLQRLTFLPDNLSNLYQQSYKRDSYHLENYNTLTNIEEYSTIKNRTLLEKYAITHNITYNILLEYENPNKPFPVDARILLMRFFSNFEFLIILFVVYCTTTSFVEEFSKGTIQNLLVKPCKRINILLSKLFSNLITILCFVTILFLFQFILGGLLFGFDSYQLGAIWLNDESIQTMPLVWYIICLFLSKVPMYLILILCSFLIGTFIHNIPINIFVVIGLYAISKIPLSANLWLQCLFIYHWDFSSFFNNSNTISASSILCGISATFLFILLHYCFLKKEIKNT